MKNYLNKITSGVFTFSLLVLISSGCEDTFFNGDNTPTFDNPAIANNTINPGGFTTDEYLLKASFEGDAVGSPPDKTLPGSPTGDALAYADGWPPIKVFSVNGQKSIYLYQAYEETGGENDGDDNPNEFISKVVDFKSRHTTIGNGDKIVVTWTGAYSNHFITFNNKTFFKLKDNYGNYIAYIWLEDVRKLRIISANQWYGTPDLFSSSPYNSIRTFTLSVNYAQHTFDIKVVNEDGAVYNESNIPFAEVPSSPPPLARAYRVTFTIEGAGKHPYRVDNVTIKKSSPLDPNPPF